MATFTVWRFGDPSGATQAERLLVELQDEELIRVQDAAVVSWPMGKRRPVTKQLHSFTAAAALDGSFWGLLFGLLFFVPMLDAGAALDALSGSMVEVGIDDDFINTIRQQVSPGTSALFVFSSDTLIDRVKAAFADLKPQLVHTNLSESEEAKLRAIFEQH